MGNAITSLLNGVATGVSLYLGLSYVMDTGGAAWLAYAGFGFNYIVVVILLDIKDSQGEVRSKKCSAK